jgi:hypothetical protein
VKRFYCDDCQALRRTRRPVPENLPMVEVQTKGGYFIKLPVMKCWRHLRKS